MSGNITDLDFDSLIKEGLVIVDAKADWCGPCKVLGPIIDELSNEMEDVSFYKLDVDSNPVKSSELQIRSIPAVFLYKDGELVDKFVGLKSKSDIIDFIASHR